jgi:hypothetical protein
MNSSKLSRLSSSSGFGGVGPAGSTEGPARSGYADDRVLAQAPREHGRKAGPVLEREQVVLARRAHVGVDEQGAFAELGEDDGEIRRQVGAALAALGADDRQHLAFLGAVEPAQHELAADRPQLLDARR